MLGLDYKTTTFGPLRGYHLPLTSGRIERRYGRVSSTRPWSPPLCIPPFPIG